MSLPHGFLEELRNRVPISQVVGRKVVWDMRRSNQAKGDFWAPCPFHQEKSASFHVDDRKGFYYCFGCQAKGDALTFLRESENLGFMEAVELLAREAGMTMPARDPAAAARTDRRAELAAVMEEAVRHYRLQLRAASGAEARAYLARRRLDAAAEARFEIGFAPDQRQGLVGALTGRGIDVGLIVEAGLAARPEDSGAPYDRFRGRIIYPIRDARGRCIALGGRAMDPNARAKYLNSPETPLFDKGRSLYNHGPARDACGKGAQLVVAEGYMDVIALVSAGIEGAVAPLGTAITEDQLRMLWRIHPEPVIALDGDAAGMRAGLRLIDLALPLLEAGQALRFAVLPGGQDPDDIIRAGGPGAMAKILAEARPMVDLIWQRETEGRSFDSPERRAGLDKALRATVARIADPSIRAHYTEEIRNLRRGLFGARAPRSGQARPHTGFGAAGQRFGPRFGPRIARPPAQPLAETRASLLAAASTGTGTGTEERMREGMVLAICATNPELLSAFEVEIERIHLSDPEHERIRAILLQEADGRTGDAAAMRERILAAAGAPLEKLLALPHVRIAPALRDAGDLETARMALLEALAKLEAHRAARSEVEEAMEDMASLADEGVTWRLAQAAGAVARASRGPDEDRRQSVVAPNGVEIDREELDLQRALFSRIDFSRGGRKGP